MPPDDCDMEDDDSTDAAVKVIALRHLLHEKIHACEALRQLLGRSNQCHQMTVCGLSKLISQQNLLLEQSAEEMARLHARFERDAPMIEQLMPAESMKQKAFDYGQ
jgi:hypothetical protein